MASTQFYNKTDEELQPLLRYGAADKNRVIQSEWGKFDGQDAYDAFMLYRYMRDLHTYLGLNDQLENVSVNDIKKQYLSGVHHRNDLECHLYKLCGLASFTGSEKQSFYELGQTLFGCIEGMMFCQNLFSCLGIDLPVVDLRKVKWMGTDISQLFNRIAVSIHADFNIDVREDQSFEKTPDLFFAKGVTMLYAINNVQELVEQLHFARLHVFDYSFSLNHSEQVKIGTGKDVHYLNWQEFESEFNANNSTSIMLVRSDRSDINHDAGRVYVEAIVGEPELCHSYCQLIDRVANALTDHPINDLFNLPTKKETWVSLSSFIGENSVHA